MHRVILVVVVLINRLLLYRNIGHASIAEVSLFNICASSLVRLTQAERQRYSAASARLRRYGNVHWPKKNESFKRAK